MITVRTAAARLTGVLVPALLATAVGVALPQPATAEVCADGDVTWTGTAANGLWSDPANWDSSQLPTATQRAVLTAAGTVTGLVGTVCGLAVSGGTGDVPATVVGDLQVSGLLDLAGTVRYLGGPATGIVAGSLTTAASTDLTFLDGTADLTVSGAAQLGGSTSVHRAADPVGGAAHLAVGGTVVVGDGGVQLHDVGLTATGVVDLKGQLLTLAGTAASSLASGTLVKDSGGGATGVLELATPVVTAGTITVNSPARVRLSPGAALDATAPTTLTGNGSLAWQGGSITGDLTLGLSSAVEGAAAKSLLGSTSRLTVPVAQTLTIGGTGELSTAGVLDNQGTVALADGAHVTGTSDEARLLNPSAALLRVDLSPSGTTPTARLLDTLPVIGNGTIRVSANERLRLTRSAWTAESPALTESLLQSGTTLRGAGVLQVGKGATVATTGTLNVVEGAVLELDDDGDGTAARLDAAGTTLLGVLSGANTNGTFRWRRGIVRGQLTVDKLRTETGSLTGSSGGVTGRQLHPLDGSARGRLTVLGPLVMQSAPVVVEPAADVVLSGAISFKLVGGFTSGTEGAPDATVTITPTGTLTVAPEAIELFGTLPSAGVFDVPLVNQGTINVQSGSSLTASTLRNQGSVVLNNGSLSAAEGYVQEKRTGATDDPTTAILTSEKPAPTPEEPDPDEPTPSTLSAATSTITINAGGLYGKGKVKAATTTVATGWMLPEYGTGAGKLTVEGNLVLGAGSDLQLFVGVKDATTAAVHDQVAVTGTATLGGRITGLTRSEYTPTYRVVASDVLTAAKGLVGSFASSAWSPSSRGLGWKPVYERTATADDPEAVNLQFVDVAPPALGLAGIPAFTHSTTQRITYAAVDNQSGIGSYDVRWKRSSPSFSGGWSYPAAWQKTTRTFVDSTGLAAGQTYCYSVRARDRANNTTNWSQPLCTTRMADDRAWSVSGTWTRPSGVTGFYGGTFSRTTQKDATMRTSGTYTRVAVSALRCPTCGLVDVYSGSTRLGRIDLRSSTSGMRTWTSAKLSLRSGSVILRMVTSGRPVVVDAVALQRP